MAHLFVELHVRMLKLGTRREDASVLPLTQALLSDTLGQSVRLRISANALRSAGQPGANASVVHHVGRTSGRRYRTPVVAQPVEDGFVIALPYGREADWVRNVVAAAGAEVEHDGRRVRVDQPRFVPSAEANHRSASNSSV